MPVDPHLFQLYLVAAVVLVSCPALTRSWW